VTSLTARQQATRRRVESVIRVAAPFLDLVLAAGDRLSRVVEPRDDWDPPVRSSRTPRLAAPRSESSGSPPD
jgi:hypothetical protein